MGVSLAVRGSLTKPAIINDKSISFDMTQVGMTSSMWVQLFNPSDLPVFAQLLYIDDKKLAQVDQPTQPFPLHPIDAVVCVYLQLPPMLGSHTVKHARSFEIGDDALRGMWLQPQMQADLGPIHFTPSAAVMSSAVFGVRNNLSMLQTVFVDGEGGSGSLYPAHNSWHDCFFGVNKPVGQARESTTQQWDNRKTTRQWDNRKTTQQWDNRKRGLIVCCK